jgi:hypothetical protein
MCPRSKRKIKGWADEPVDDNQAAGLRERLGGNDRVWLSIAAVVLVVGLIGALYHPRSGDSDIPKAPRGSREKVLTSGERVKFLSEFERTCRRRGVEVQATFEGGKRLSLVMPNDVDMDDLNFLSRTAALMLNRKFEIDPTVLSYTEDIGGKEPRLVARTHWDSEIGDYVVVGK